MGLPYLGYLCGYLAARIFKQPGPDCLAIALETGIQNTGIAIFLLRFTLPQPQADLTTSTFSGIINSFCVKTFIFSCSCFCGHYDTFTTSSGVLLQKNQRQVCVDFGFLCVFMWVF